MSARVLLLGAGVALWLLTSSFLTGLLGAPLFVPETPPFEVVYWSARGLLFIWTALSLWSLFQSQLRAAGPVGELEPTSAAPRVARENRRAPGAEARDAEQRGSFLAAAELYDRVGDLQGASRAYAAALRETVHGSREHARLLPLAANRLWAAGQHAEAADLALEHDDVNLAAELRRRAGDHQGRAALIARTESGVVGAAQVLSQAGDRIGAARLLFESGDQRRAVELLSQEKPTTAARVLEDWDQPLLAAEFYIRAGDQEGAATLYARHGKPKKAAELYEQLGYLEMAAPLYEEGDSLADAARLRLELGELEAAGALFRKAGAPGAFGQALEARGNHLAASRAYLAAGNNDDALRVLSLLPPKAQQEPKTRLLTAAILLRLGKADRAISVLRPVVSEGATSQADRTEAYYALGLAYQTLGDLPQAIAAMEVVSTMDSRYRDVALRLAELRSLAQKKPPVASSPTPAPPMLPPRYKIEKKLGEGAMGIVYRATDTVLNRPVAVKVLSEQLVDNEKARSYFLREARAAAGLSHPNIVTLYDAGIEGSLLYLVMEYLKGVDLETETVGKPIAEARALHFVVQIADALAYVHERNIVHRDVKPANVMRVESTEVVKLMDFGVAHLTEGKGKSTIVAGTPDFMAPEQLVGRGLGPWTDVYALGGTLHQFLTGSVPYPEGTADDEPPDPRRRVPSVSAATAEVVLACLSKDPKHRPQSAGALRDLVAALLK